MPPRRPAALYALLLPALLLAAGCATVHTLPAPLPPGAPGSPEALVAEIPDPDAPPAAAPDESPDETASSLLDIRPSFGPLRRAHFAEPDGTRRTVAAGPFYETATYPDGTSLYAPFRPVYSSGLRPDPRDYRHDWESLWPLAQGKTLHRDRSWRILNLYHNDRDIADPLSPTHTTFFPFLFYGRARDGRPYAAIFPLGGSIGDFLVKERIEFLLWPIWMRSYVNDVTTTDILWPIWSRTTTPDNHIDKFRILPFYARSDKAGKFHKVSVLWPFWTHADYLYPNSSGTSWVLWPFCGRTDLTDQTGWSVLPPLIQHGEATNGDFRTYAPWPFYVHVRKGSIETLRLWPFYGRYDHGNLRRRYWAWPLLTHEKNAYSTVRYRRWTFVPFYSSAAYTRAPSAAPKPPPRHPTPEQRAAPPSPDPYADPDAETPISGHTKLWPLFTYQTRHEPDTATRFAALDLWPGPAAPAVERSWAPFWTLFDYRTYAATPRASAPDASSLSLLWGLYRQSHAPDAPAEFELFPIWRHVRAPDDADRHWSVLKGLLAYDRAPDAKRLRLLWFIPIPLP